jgi:hypothetical protein
VRFCFTSLVASAVAVLAMTGAASARSTARAKTDTGAAITARRAAVETVRSGLVPATLTTVDTDAEQRFLSRINRARAQRGLPPLVRDETLRDLARFHSADMAMNGFVGLSSPGAGSLLDRAAQAAGVSIVDMTAQVASGSDLSQVGGPLLDPSTRRVGVGIVAASGRLFLTQLWIAGDAPRGYTAADAAPRSFVPYALSSWIERIGAAIDRALRGPSRFAFGPR